MQDDYEDSYIEESVPQAREDAPARQEAVAEPDYEAEARKQGWKPKEEFDGPSDKWRPAKEFVDRGNEDPRILRSRVDKLDKLYEGVKRQWQADLTAKEREFNARVERLNKVSELALQRQRESYEGQIAAAKRAAVAEGDAERYDQLDQHERAVKQQWAQEDKEVLPQAQPVAKPNGAAPPPAEVDGWIKRNPWFNKDQALTDEATAYEDYLAKAKPGLSLEERLEETRKHVVNQFPHKFGKKPGMNGNGEARRGASPVEGSQRSAASGDSDGGFGQLPSEARQQFKAFVKEKLFVDDAAGRAKYARYYNNPNADKVNG
jgi:hypothetical protein